MNLNEQIYRIHEMMGLNENKLPENIRRRLKLSYEDVQAEIVEWLIRYFYDNPKDVAISNAMVAAAQEILAHTGFDFEQEDKQETLQKIKKYLEDQYREKINNYYDEVLTGDEDKNVYCFIKHKDLGGGRGFSDCKQGWYLFLSTYGYWLPKVDWNSVKKELLEMPPGRKKLLAKHKEGHNYEYYFSIIRHLPYR